MKILSKIALLSGIFVSSVQAQEEAVSDRVDPAAERENLLQVLKTEIEPNLMKKDIRTLNRNVMRLGSYRAEWAGKGREFLVANAPLAELYLYSYTQVGNLRLNKMIVKTLLDFKQYRYPRGPWAFFASMKASPDLKAESLVLFNRLIDQSEAVWPLYRDLVFGSAWGDDISAPAKLKFALRACESGLTFSPENQSLFEELVQDLRGFWSNYVGRELRSCLRGV